MFVAPSLRLTRPFPGVLCARVCHGCAPKLGTGKLFHPGHPLNGDGNQSWSDLPVQFSCNHSSAGGAGTYCLPDCAACDTPGTPGAPRPRWCSLDAPLNGSIAGTNITQPFCDIVTVGDALKKLNYAAEHRHATGEPWFVGVGFQKPHLDWRIPKGWLDYYPAASQISVAKHPAAQPLRPVCLKRSTELLPFPVENLLVDTAGVL